MERRLQTGEWERTPREGLGITSCVKVMAVGTALAVASLFLHNKKPTAERLDPPRVEIKTHSNGDPYGVISEEQHKRLQALVESKPERNIPSVAETTAHDLESSSAGTP